MRFNEQIKFDQVIQSLLSKKVITFSLESLYKMTNLDKDVLKELVGNLIKNEEVDIIYRIYNPDDISESFDFFELTDIPYDTYYESSKTGESFYISRNNNVEIIYKFSPTMVEEYEKMKSIPKVIPSVVCRNTTEGEKFKLESLLKNMNNNNISQGNNALLVYGNNNNINYNVGADAQEVLAEFDKAIAEVKDEHSDLKRLLINAKGEVSKSNWGKAREIMSSVKTVLSTVNLASETLKKLVSFFI